MEESTNSPNFVAPFIYKLCGYEGITKIKQENLTKPYKRISRISMISMSWHTSIETDTLLRWFKDKGGWFLKIVWTIEICFEFNESESG